MKRLAIIMFAALIGTMAISASMYSQDNFSCEKIRDQVDGALKKKNAGRSLFTIGIVCAGLGGISGIAGYLTTSDNSVSMFLPAGIIGVALGVPTAIIGGSIKRSGNRKLIELNNLFEKNMCISIQKNGASINYSF